MAYALTDDMQTCRGGGGGAGATAAAPETLAAGLPAAGGAFRSPGACWDAYGTELHRCLPEMDGHLSSRWHNIENTSTR